jgi:hypothetical protein
VTTSLRDAWGLKCTCEAADRFATWHSSACALFQKFPADGRAPASVTNHIRKHHRNEES